MTMFVPEWQKQGWNKLEGLDSFAGFGNGEVVGFIIIHEFLNDFSYGRREENEPVSFSRIIRNIPATRL
jgi:hypothetical protein